MYCIIFTRKLLFILIGIKVTDIFILNGNNRMLENNAKLYLNRRTILRR